ncbi:hypothetical protein STENM223S_10498 [Streptomyces tendae]
MHLSEHRAQSLRQRPECGCPVRVDETTSADGGSQFPYQLRHRPPPPETTQDVGQRPQTVGDRRQYRQLIGYLIRPRPTGSVAVLRIVRATASTNVLAARVKRRSCRYRSKRVSRVPNSSR